MPVLSRRYFAMLLAAGLSAQTPALVRRPEETGQDDDATLRVNVDLVNLLCTVRKKTGELVPNLTQDDFLVFEDDKQQTVSNFSRDANLPLELGMLIDISATQSNVVETEKQAASSFFGNVIKAKDEAFLLSFGRDTVLAQDFTGSVPRLQSALSSLKGDVVQKASNRSSGNPGGGNSGGGGYPGRSGGGYPGGGGGGIGFPGSGGGWPGGGGMGRRGGRNGGNNPSTTPTPKSSTKNALLYDAVYLACTDEIGHRTGRKMLMLVTAGEDQGSYYRRDQAIEAAQRADTILYGIYYADPKTHRGGDDTYTPTDLQRMSDETGGRVFRVSADHTLEDVFTEIQAEMRSQYSIAYKPLNRERNGEFREIEVRTKNPDYKVQTRKGYYATRNRLS